MSERVETAGPVLYRWPAAARFGRVVPKIKFYEHAAVPAALREKFVADVQRITWAYKLAEGTIHLRGTAAVPEIQVFTIDVKDADVSDDVLTVIDKAVKFPIIFEITRGAPDQARTRMTAAHKQLGTTAPRLSGYFTTGWQNPDATRGPLPPALDLPGLYAALLASILPIQTRPGEAMSEAAGRMEQARKLEREIAGLEKRLRTEPQFNRKIDLRRQLRDRTNARDALLSASPTDPATLKTEDAPWRN